jgi:hypothetical protein
MEIGMGFAKALARFGYIQTHAAETLVARTRENDRLISMLQGEPVWRHGWHPSS